MAERIVGIDFGTSTSAIRVQRYLNGKPEKAVPVAVTFHSSPIVPTLIQKQADLQSAYYGYDAEVPRKKALMFQNFKLELESLDEGVREDARALTAEYLKSCLGTAYRQHSYNGFLGDSSDEVTTYISYPVKWNEETRDFMIKAAENAGFPNVKGLDEAQACIRAVTEQNAAMLTEKGFFQKGTPSTILLIDMGAGTTDMVLCRHTPGKKSSTEILGTWPRKGESLFGGHTIDDILYSFIKESFPNVKAIERLPLNTFKAWKEAVVSPTLKRDERVDYFAALEPIEATLGEELVFDTIDRKKFESLTGDYLKVLPEMINDFLENVQMQGRNIDLVILTGGHSQWYFVKEMLRGNMPQFGVIRLDKIKAEPERIVSLLNPQETVALGLVYKNTPLVFPEPDPKPAPDPVWPTEANEQYKMAQAYENGQGVPQNSKWAFTLYKMAAEQGHPQAQYQLGICYREGRGIERNSQESIKWLLKAKKNGITIAGAALSKTDPHYMAEEEVRVAKENLNDATYQLKDSFKTSMEELKDIWEAGIKSFKSGWNEGKNIFGDNKK